MKALFLAAAAAACLGCQSDPEPQPTTGTPGSAIPIPIGCKALAKEASAPDLKVDGKAAHCPAEDQVCALGPAFAANCNEPEVAEARCVASIWQVQCRELPSSDAGTDAAADAGDAGPTDAATGDS